MADKSGLHSPLEEMEPVPSIHDHPAGAQVDHYDGHFDKPRSPGGLPIVICQEIPGARVPTEATVPGDAGDLRLPPGTGVGSGGKY